MEETNHTPETAAPAPSAAGTGSVPVTPDRAAFERMGYRERLALKREDPAGYAALRGRDGNATNL